MAKIDIAGFEAKVSTINSNSGLRRVTASKELLDRVRDFTVDVLKEDFSIKNIRNFKEKGNEFSFNCGSGYDIVGMDLLNTKNSTGERTKVFEEYCRYCKEPNIKNLEMLNSQIESHNNSRYSSGDLTEKIQIEKFKGYKELEEKYEEKSKIGTISKKKKVKEGNER